MILILSQATYEPTTEFVMDWIENLGASCLRLNAEDFDGGCAVNLRLSAAGTELAVYERPHGAADETGAAGDRRLPLPLDQVRAVWYRRWQIHGHRATELVDRRHGIAQRARIDLYRYLSLEVRRLSEVLFARLAGVPWLGSQAEASPNKLLVLERAVAAGLDIPATLVTTSRAEVERFAALHGPLITKAVSEAQFFELDGHHHAMHTLAVEPADIAALPESFPASLFQERLAKRYELRVFYLTGECYAMAIFSQSDPQTQIDFRHYNFARPNRNVPYRLPAVTATGIDALMRSLGMGTGSLDLVKTTSDRMVFLEVNPIGQFTMVSKPCNYHLERRVAETLIRKAADGTT